MSGVEQVEAVDSGAEGDASLEGADAAVAPSEPAGREPAAPAEPEIPLDVIFDILKNQRRRHVFKYLKEHETATLSDLAEHVAALENDKEISHLTSTERKRVYVGLYQCHLPRMDDAGIIDFDSDRGTVVLNDRASQLDDYLLSDTAGGRPWPVYYGGISLAGGAAYVLSWVLSGGATLLPSLVVLSVIACIAGCAFLHHRAEGPETDD